jgi:hypothetical protein
VIPPLPYSLVVPDAEPAAETTRGFGSGKGRVKGIPNKVTLALKEAILLAAEEAGDRMAEAAAENGEERTGGLAGYLVMVATTDIKAFAGLLGRVLPMTIKGEGESGAIVVEIVRMATERAAGSNAAHPTA